MAPGLDFAFGVMGDGYIDKAMDNHWLLMSGSVATPATINNTKDLQVRAVLEPIRDLKIDLNASRMDNRSQSIQYMYEGRPTTYSGSFNMTTISLRGALAGIGNANNGYHSSAFDHFRSILPQFQNGVEKPYSAEALVPAFLSAYTMGAGNSRAIFPAITRMLPNWSIRYSGLSRLPGIADYLKSLNLNHAYKSIYSVGSYTLPSIPTVSINESFSPLIGVDATFQNNLTTKVEYRTTRTLNLSMTSIQINEALSRDWVVGVGYKIQDFNLFGAAGNRKVKKAQNPKSRAGKNANGNQNAQNSKQNTQSSKSGINHDLNLRLDVSLRKQAAITRDIATGTSSASSGNTAFKISFMADYTLSRLLTLTAYYDQQTNTPLLSSSSYPTTTYDFGLSMKFSLTL
jgi:opacity protein-like surface antigen